MTCLPGLCRARAKSLSGTPTGRLPSPRDGGLFLFCGALAVLICRESCNSVKICGEFGGFAAKIVLRYPYLSEISAKLIYVKALALSFKAYCFCIPLVCVSYCSRTYKMSGVVLLTQVNLDARCVSAPGQAGRHLRPKPTFRRAAPDPCESAVHSSACARRACAEIEPPCRGVW